MTFAFKDIQNSVVTYPYAVLNTAYKSGKHDGVDLYCYGDRTVLSVSNGNVIRSGWNNSWGNYIVVEMINYESIIYAHLASRKVTVGNIVHHGMPIGVMGHTGNCKSSNGGDGAHLHIELQKKYYTAGNTGDICKLMGIANVKGKVRLLK